MKKFNFKSKLPTLNFVLVLALSLIASRIVQAEDFGGQTSGNPVCHSAPLTEYQPVPPSGPESGPLDHLSPGEIDAFPDLVKYECLANNTDCAVFYAINPNPNFAQDAAMNLCFDFGLPCRPLGCHRLW